MWAREGMEAEAGDHDEAVASLIDYMLVWSMQCLTSAGLAYGKQSGTLPIDWALVVDAKWLLTANVQSGLHSDA